MQAFTEFKGIVVPLDRPNVDTDAIIPKQYLKSIKRTGFGVNLFDDWRYLDPGEPGQDMSKRRVNEEFVLNQDRYRGAGVLLARENFGCGSSREHAVWALMDHGIRVVIAPSFADIFFNNSFKNGFLPIILDAEIVNDLFEKVAAIEGFALTVNLESKTVTLPDGEAIAFEIEDYRRYRLLNGLDDIGLTLQATDDIRSYESQRQQSAPWLFAGIK